MKSNEDLLQEIREITKIRDLENISEIGTIKILNLIGEHKLNEEQINALIALAPSFISMATEALKTISSIVPQVGETQREVLKNIGNSINSINTVLSTLANKVESDEVRLKIAEYTIRAGELYLEFTKLQAKINENNNETWWKITGTVSAIVAATAALVVISMNPRGNSN